jgi:hypothetical protein
MWFFIILLLVIGFIVWRRTVKAREQSGEIGMYSGIIKKKDLKGELHITETGRARAFIMIQGYMRDNGAIAHEKLTAHQGYFFMPYRIETDELDPLFYGILYHNITKQSYQQSASAFLHDVERDFSNDTGLQKNLLWGAKWLFWNACEQYMKKEFPGRAASVFFRLGNLGFDEAQYNYAVARRIGRGAENDIYDSVEWLKEPAENGLPIAMQNLGIHYFNGDGVEHDRVLGIQWVQKAVDAGFSHAAKVLEKMNKTPEGKKI